MRKIVEELSETTKNNAIPQKQKKSAGVSVNIALSILSAILLRGISILIAPIVTRILTVSEYGHVVNYGAWLTIISVFIGLQVGGSIQNAIIEYPDLQTRRKYYSNALTIGFFSFLLVGTILMLLNKPLSGLLDVDPILLYILAPNAFGMFCIGFLAAHCIAHKKPLYNFIISTMTSLSMGGLGILLALLAESNKYIYFSIGYAVPPIVLGCGVFLYYILKGRSFFDKKLWSFVLIFSIPLVFHALSGILLTSVDKLMIKHMFGGAKGNEAMAVYALAVSFTALISMIWSAMNSAFVPFYYDYLRAKDQEQIRKKVGNISWLFMLLCGGFIFCAPEVFKILFPTHYYDAVVYIPLMTMSAFFTSLYSFSANYEFFHKKTIWLAIGTAFAGLLSLGLNLLIIPILGSFGAALTSAISYFVLFIAHEVVARKVIKGFPIRKAACIPVICVMIALTLLWYVLYLYFNYWLVRWAFAAGIGVVIILRIKKQKGII